MLAWPSSMRKLGCRFKSRRGYFHFSFFSFWSFFFHRLFTLLLVSVYSHCWPFFASRDFCDNVLLVLVWLQHCPWIALISTTLTKKTFPSRRWTNERLEQPKKHCYLASPQTSFGVRLSRIRNECVTNEPQRTSAGRLIATLIKE